ncbi:MAG TPA: hypothetical protein VIV40_38405, partial [Kofleriaceae bacterium]
TSFSPLIAWRLAFGHENLLFGLLPFLAALTLLVAARARTLTITSLGFAVLAIANGISGLGAQTVFYSAVFGAPVLVALALGVPRDERWSRRHWIAVAAVVAAVLVVLPRLSVMVAHAVGPDASRALSEEVTYSFGKARLVDWITSLPWSTAPAASWGGATSIHEHNYSLGPLVLLAIALWPRSASRAPLVAIASTLLIVLLFAADISPVSSVLLKLVPPLGAFRVPARAVLPLLVLVPTFALAATYTAPTQAATLRVRCLGLIIALTVLAVGERVPDPLREVIAWLGVIALVVMVRRWPERAVRWTLPIVVALGVIAFSVRFPRAIPVDTAEQGPRALRELLYEKAPELRNSALDRVEIVNAPWPFHTSLAWTAQLSSLDGVWYPPRRFLELIGTLSDQPVSSTACVFQLTQAPAFPLLQQLYNVRYRIAFQPSGWTLQRYPETPGPAWFPASIETIASAADMRERLRAPASDAPSLLRTTGWLLARDRAPFAVSPACAGAVVEAAGTDELGQLAAFDVKSPDACPLIVATNYVSTFRATATVDGAAHDAEVFPIDVALTAIVVPRGATRVTLAPEVSAPVAAYIAAIVGLLALGAACIALTRLRASE